MINSLNIWTISFFDFLSKHCCNETNVHNCSSNFSSYSYYTCLYCAPPILVTHWVSLSLFCVWLIINVSWCLMFFVKHHCSSQWQRSLLAKKQAKKKTQHFNGEICLFVMETIAWFFHILICYASQPVDLCPLIPVRPKNGINQKLALP